MQLGIRLHDIKKAPLEERLSIAHEQGFAGLGTLSEKAVCEKRTGYRGARMLFKPCKSESGEP